LERCACAGGVVRDGGDWAVDLLLCYLAAAAGEFALLVAGGTPALPKKALLGFSRAFLLNV
jgi:hypothetical protein